MLGSMAVIVPLVLFLRGSDRRVNMLQRCLVFSVLVHAPISFGFELRRSDTACQHLCEAGDGRRSVADAAKECGTGVVAAESAQQ